MRILHIHSGNLFGGVESVLRTLARSRHLVPRLEPVFALAYEGRIAQELRAAGCDVHLLGAARASRPLSVLSARAKLSGVRRRLGADIVMAHSAWSLALLGPAAGRPLMLFLHDLLDGQHWLEKWSRLTPPNRIIANSQFTAQSVGRVHPSVPVTVIYPPAELTSARITPALRRKLRRDRGVEDAQTVILQAGRFEPWKGHLPLLRALALLSSRSDWVLWIAGSSQRPREIELKQEIQRTAQALGIFHRVQFLGHQSAMPETMAAADIYCQPNSGPEPFGLTFVEAMQAGLPVVTTNIGGAREIVDDSCGLRVTPDHPGEIARALEQLLRDPAQRGRMGAAGEVRASMLCDAPTQIRRIASVAEALCSKAHAAA